MHKLPEYLPDFGAAIAGQGGNFAAILRGPTVDGIQQLPVALIVADRAHHLACAWGERGRNIAGCDSRVDGQSNTLAMLLEECPAAKHARGLIIDGHSDFFVPAIGQLNAAAANAPELFDPKGICWSSTQASSLSALAQVFELGFSLWFLKHNEFLVVPVRVIPLQLLISSTL